MFSLSTITTTMLRVAFSYGHSFKLGFSSSTPRPFSVVSQPRSHLHLPSHHFDIAILVLSRVSPSLCTCSRFVLPSLCFSLTKILIISVSYYCCVDEVDVYSVKLVLFLFFIFQICKIFIWILIEHDQWFWHGHQKQSQSKMTLCFEPNPSEYRRFCSFEGVYRLYLTVVWWSDCLQYRVFFASMLP